MAYVTIVKDEVAPYICIDNSAASDYLYAYFSKDTVSIVSFLYTHTLHHRARDCSCVSRCVA